MYAIVLNAGSSTYKCSLFRTEDLQSDKPSDPIWEANLDWGENEGIVRSSVTGQDNYCDRKVRTDNPQEELCRIIASLWQKDRPVLPGPDAVAITGHRVVHGGKRFLGPCEITPQVEQWIQEAAFLAPLHNPLNLKGINLFQKTFPKSRHAAVFDTSFHKEVPRHASLYPIPLEWEEKGVRRYGFHGISHQYCTRRCQQLLGRQPNRLVTCHLGNGASLAAIAKGVSIDTTMGFTPLEGLMMGTRSGSIDPGILLHLLKEYNFKHENLEELLWHKSGLKGISSCKDMREVISRMREKDANNARLAFDMFVYSVKKHIGAMAAVLDGLDALVFTGGIGEHSHEIRLAVCGGLSSFGLVLDSQKNRLALPDQDIASSEIPVFVIHTREEWEIAKQAISCFEDV